MRSPTLPRMHRLEQERNLAHMALALIFGLVELGMLGHDIKNGSERAIQLTTGVCISFGVALIIYFRVLSVNLLTMLISYLNFIWVFADCLISIINDIAPQPQFYIVHVLSNMLCFSWLSIKRAFMPCILLNLMLMAYIFIVQPQELHIATWVLLANFCMGFVTIFGRRISEARLHNEILQQVALTDPLTELLNRRGAWEKLSDLLQSREGAILMIDIDRFKQINDNLGHAVGDEVLVQLAQILTNASGKNAIVSRWGGEEFLIIFRNIGPNDAQKLAQSIVAKVQNVRVGQQILSVSIGLALSKEASNRDTLVALADHRMYQAKAAGGNQYI